MFRTWTSQSLLLPLILCGSIGCTTRKTARAVPEQNSPQRPAPENEAPEESSPLPPTNAPCGLPQELVERGFPRHLAPTSEIEQPKPSPGSTTFAVLPDTQYYVNCRNDHVRNQANYIAAETERRNILFTIGLGDLTEHNTEEEWAFVKEALSPLFEKTPLFLATGNHDYGDQGSANERTTLFGRYFNDPATITHARTAELMKAGDWENAYYRVPLKTTTLGVMVLEWSPRINTVKWAQEVFTSYPQDRVIFVTHAYLYHDGTRYDWASKGEEQEWNPRAYGTAKKDPEGKPEKGNWAEHGAYDGQMLWEALVREHAGVFLTLNGHVLGDGQGLLSERGSNGNLVHQVLTNYQMLEEGGLGYLKLVEISEQGDTLTFKTYSPSLKRFATADDQSFQVPIDPPLFE